MSEEQRMIEGYEVKHAIQLASAEVVLAEDQTSEKPYMVCDCTWKNPFNLREYYNGFASGDYLDVMREFITRVTSRVAAIERQRKERGVTHIPLTEADCIAGSKHENYTNRLVVIDPDCLTPSSRTADNQLLLAENGNGCRPDARGTAVFCKNLITGESSRFERYDIAGIIDPEKIPSWAAERLAVMRASKEQPNNPHPKANRKSNDAR